MVMKSLRSLQGASVLQMWEPLQSLGGERHDHLSGLESPLWLNPGEQTAEQDSGNRSPGRRLLQLSSQEELGLGQSQ